MLIPVRCFTCNKVVGNKWETYCKLLETYDTNETLNILGLVRVCCRRMLISHANIIDDIIENN